MMPPSPERLKRIEEETRIKKIEKLARKILMHKTGVFYGSIKESVEQAEYFYKEIDKLKTK